MEKQNFKEIMTFDHSKDDYAEAVGITPEEIDEITIKMAAIFKEYFTSTRTQSEVTEQVCELFTIKELIFMASKHVFLTIEKFEEKHPHVKMLQSIRDLAKSAGMDIEGLNDESLSISPDKLDFVKGVHAKWKDREISKTTETPKPYIKPED
jgi:SepF-like predicted cell division protein (DUF552 family)